MNNTNKVAFITGASRGIGKEAAIALARQGFDVVITARTLHEGESHERGAEEVRTISGSLDSTAREVEALGQQALPIRLDLLDTESIRAAVDLALKEWGHIDLLLNNGLYQGPGIETRIMDLPTEQMAATYQGNVFSPLLLVQLCLAPMLERGGGCIINMASASATLQPTVPLGKGGWSYAYCSSKAALMAMAGILSVEHPDSGVQFFNLDPGFTITEIMKAKGIAENFKRFGGAPPTVAAAAIAWLATNHEANQYQGQTIEAQRLCLKKNLLPEWQPNQNNEVQ